MKKILLVLLFIVLVFGCIGCSSKSDTLNVSTPENYDIIDFFNKHTDEPLILYECEGIGKSVEVRRAYVIKNGQCRLYHCETTMGELANMTDIEILKMLEEYYLDGLGEACDNWQEDSNMYDAILTGKIKLYEPRAYDITGCLLTDETGNSVVGELLFFPESGIDGNPYVIEYPQYTEKEYLFLNYYGYYGTTDRYGEITFNNEYFNTGMGTVSDLNQINNLYYISNDSTISGTVYSSYYYGLRSKGCKWVNNAKTLCFRTSQPNRIHLRWDDMSSTNIAYVDPTENDLLQISYSYYNSYYSSFKPFSEVINAMVGKVGNNSAS